MSTGPAFARAGRDPEADAVEAERPPEPLLARRGQVTLALPGDEDVPELELVYDLLASRAVSPVGLLLDDPDFPWERYVALLRFFQRLHRSVRWWIGDLLNHGEKLYGEKYTQAVDESGLRKETLMQYASICARVARSRRRPELGVSHHEAVAALEPDAQDEWLGRAVEEGWTRDKLRHELREAGADPGKGEQPQWSDVEGKVSPRRQLEEAANAVVDAAVRDGAEYRVAAEPMARLLAAVGKGE